MNKIKYRYVIPIGLVIAILGSIAAILLAVGNNWGGTFNASLGVLTATLITIIWYTYFTFIVIVRKEKTLVGLDLKIKSYKDGLHLYPIIRNFSRRRAVARVFLDVWWDEQKRTIDNFYNGGDDYLIEPYVLFTGHIQPPPISIPATWKSIPEKLKVKFTIKWEDDLGYKGETLPKYWRIRKQNGNIILVSVVEKSIIKELFTDEN